MGEYTPLNVQLVLSSADVHVHVQNAKLNKNYFSNFHPVGYLTFPSCLNLLNEWLNVILLITYHPTTCTILSIVPILSTT